MIRSRWGVLVLAAVCFDAADAGATARALTAVGRVSAESGVINDAFALDDAGQRLAWVETTAQGTVRLHVGGVTGGKSSTVDLTDFTVTPERIVSLGGQWIVVANEGEQRAAAVVSGEKLSGRIGPFGDGTVTAAGGKKFVTVTERSESAGRSFTIAAYRPGGGLLAQKRLTVGPAGDLAGTNLGFIGFVNGYLQVLVKKPGAYNAKADVREPAKLAVYDVLAGKAGPGKMLPDIPRFLDLAAKRTERPGAEVFVRRNEKDGLELVGPGDKLRPLALPERLSVFEPTATIAQQVLGGRLLFSLVRDPIVDGAVLGKKGPRALAFFAVDAAGGKVTPLGEVSLGEETAYAWAAGGSRIAVLRKTHESSGMTIEVYQ